MGFLKTLWTDRTAPKITAAQLNRIEQGIADAIAWQAKTPRKVQRAGMQGAFSSGGTGAVPAFAQSFAVVPGDYVLVMQFSGFYNPPSAVSYWIDYQFPDGTIGQSPGGGFFFNNANTHATLPPLSVDLTITTAGTLKVWPQWGGLSDSADRCEFLLIPKDAGLA